MLGESSTLFFTFSMLVSGIKCSYDCDLVTTKEPFQKLFNQGMILAYSYRDSNGKYYNPEDVDLTDAEPKAKATGETLTSKLRR